MSAISSQEQGIYWRDDGDVGFVLDQHTELECIMLVQWNNSLSSRMHYPNSEQTSFTCWCVVQSFVWSVWCPIR
jgi:hypothetical protein